MICPHGQEVKTPPSQGGIRGSIPLEGTILIFLRFQTNEFGDNLWKIVFFILKNKLH